eukprot:2734594-Amphidinium_carterae.1
MTQPSTGTPPPLILTPGGPLPVSVTQNQLLDSTGYEPNQLGTQPPGGTPALPPLPHSGGGDRRGPYGPIAGRVPITPPGIAGAVLHDHDDMDVGEPDNPMAIAELVEHLTETSTTTLRRVYSLQINLQLQQHDVTHEEEHANRLRQEATGVQQRHWRGSAQTTLLQTGLGQSRRQAAAQLSSLRAELAQALEELHQTELHLTLSLSPEPLPIDGKSSLNNQPLRLGPPRMRMSYSVPGWHQHGIT